MSISLEGMSPEAISGLAMLAKGLSENPATRNDFLKMTKTANPGVSIPEIDIPNQINSKLEEERKKREELEAKILESEVRQTIRDRREGLMKSKGLTFDQIQEVEKMMTEKGIANHETAADFFLSQQRAATPTPSGGSSAMHAMPKPDLKDFGGNIKQYAVQEARNVIDELRGRRVA